MPSSSTKSSSNEDSSPRVVMAFGTFDYFHAGHENYLKQAKALGDTLIVVLAKDDTAKRVKGNKPDHSERRRLRDLLTCKYVDKAVTGNTDDKYKIIKKHKPNILALGYDQFVFTHGLNKFFIKEKLDIEVIRTLAFKPETFKSSIIKGALKDSKTHDSKADAPTTPDTPSTHDTSTTTNTSSTTDSSSTTPNTCDQDNTLVSKD